MSAMIAASAAARRALARESSESENSAYHARLTHATSESPAAGASVRSNDCVAKNAKSATIAASDPAARRMAIDSEASATMTMMPFDQASRLPTGVSGRARSATTAARSTMPEHVAASASTTGRRVQTIASVAPIAIETAAATPASRPQTDRRARCRNARNSVLGYTPSGAWTRIDVLVSAPARACGRARSRRAPRPVPQPSVRAVRADPVRFRSGDLRADGKARQRRTGAAAVHVRAAYLVAVDSWLAVPWFIVAPPGLATLSVSIVLVNVLTGLAIVVALERWGGLRPLAAVVVSLPFLLVPPPVSGDLVSTSGAKGLPVPVRRPPVDAARSAVLVRIAARRGIPAARVHRLRRGDHRRRGAAGPPAVLAAGRAEVAARAGRVSRRAGRDFGAAAARGPAGPGHEGTTCPAGSRARRSANLTARVDVRSSDRAPRLDAMLRVHLARLMGVTSPDELKRPRPVVAWIVVLLFAAALYRIIAMVWCVVRARASPDLRRAAFGWYLLGVGCLAALVYAGARPVRLEYTRYGLLVLFIPVGLLAVTLALDRSRWARRAVAAAAGLWRVPVVDAWRLLSPLFRSRTGGATNPGRCPRRARSPQWLGAVLDRLRRDLPD